MIKKGVEFRYSVVFTDESRVMFTGDVIEFLKKMTDDLSLIFWGAIRSDERKRLLIVQNS